MAHKNDNHNEMIFSILSSKIREKIMQILFEKPVAFMQLSRSLNISSSKLTFHLKKMKKVIKKSNGKYHLNEMGRAVYTLACSLKQLSIPEERVKIASVGMILEPNDVDFNIKKALRSIDFVSSQGVNLICLPFINISKPIPLEKIITPFDEKAKDLRTLIIFGFSELMDGNTYYSTVLARPINDFEVYRSIHRNLFVPVRLSTGNSIIVTDTKIGKIGLACGFEYIYPELFRILKLKGADYVVCPTFGLQENSRKIIRSILIARAIENQIVVALSSSSFFRKEPLGIVCSPNQEISLTYPQEDMCINNLDMSDIRKNKEHFKLFFPRRVELYEELMKEDKTLSDTDRVFLAATVLFPIKKVRRSCKVHSEDFVRYEEVTVFGKPLHMNLPMSAYIYGIVPFKEARNVRWFDDFGTLDTLVVGKKPLLRFMISNRSTLIPSKSYSIGFRCKTSDPIKAEGHEVFLHLSFRDYNELLEFSNYTIEEFEVEIEIGSRFDIIRSTPVYNSRSATTKATTLTWKWARPRKFSPLEITLRERAFFPNSRRQRV